MEKPEEIILDMELIQQKVIENINNNETNGVKQMLAVFKGDVDFVVEKGLTPLQLACRKGNRDMVHMLLILGANVNHRNDSGSTALHFAAFSGNLKLCRDLLEAGTNATIKNIDKMMAAEVAAAVENYRCAELINNYVPRYVVAQYTTSIDEKNKPLVSAACLDSFQTLVECTSFHPLRIALNLKALNLLDNLPGLQKALRLMFKAEQERGENANDGLKFKSHYYSWILGEIIACEGQQKTKATDQNEDGGADEYKNDALKPFFKRALKKEKFGIADYTEFVKSDPELGVPFDESSIFGVMMEGVIVKKYQPAHIVMRSIFNKYWISEVAAVYCGTCGEENAAMRCIQCKEVYYCDSTCQRIHWTVHKKKCVPANEKSPTPSIESNDIEELIDETAKLSIN